MSKAKFLIPQNSKSNIKNIVAVMSGKGGVGKSTVTALLASNLAQKGFRVGILDADITGPSIPKMFGIKARAEVSGGFFVLPQSNGIQVMSINFLLEEESSPVIWRSPLVIKAIKDFWTKSAWGDLDYLLIDLPPGTGDVPLTVMQTIPLKGMVLVTSPHDVTVMIVKKAVNMVRKVGIPVLALIENMSYFRCPCCGQDTFIFGESKVKEIARESGISATAVLPLDGEIAKLEERGEIYQYVLPQDVSRII
ncbi:MAG: Mrp/NBP35 family ATP-binding protein [Bacillota bacterium]|nr:Mrp/NBP35 family ATP-binding protein [Clostridia bacterium]